MQYKRERCTETECRKELLGITSRNFENVNDICDKFKRETDRIDEMCREMCRIRTNQGKIVVDYGTFKEYVKERCAESVKRFAHAFSERMQKTNKCLIIMSPEDIEYYASDYVEEMLYENRGERNGHGREETGVDHPGMLRVSFGGFREDAGEDGGERGDGRSDAGSAGEAPTEREGAGGGPDPDGVSKTRI